MIHSEYRNLSAGEHEIVIPSVVSMLKIEVPSGTTTVQGKMLKDSEDYYPLMGIISSSYDGKLALTGRGLYTVEAAGLWSCKIKNDSEINIKLLY